MNDEARFKQVATDLADRLSHDGLRPITFKQHDAWTNGWWTPVASWRKDRPKIGVWLDDTLTNDKRYFWFGFFSRSNIVADLVWETRTKFPQIVMVRSKDLESDSAMPLEQKKKEIRQKGGVTHEEYEDDDDDFRYFGKYEVGFPARSDGELVNQAASFIVDVIEYVDPDWAEERDIKELEHVPPQLNQGDSHGAEDGRGYRH